MDVQVCCALDGTFPHDGKIRIPQISRFNLDLYPPCVFRKLWVLFPPEKHILPVESCL